MPAGRIAKLFNAEGIPSPNAGRTYKRKGILLETSGLWTANTIRNLATHPFLISLMEYGKRSSGDQMRFTPTQPRNLNETDFTESGKLKTVMNPEDQRIRVAIPGNPTPVIDLERWSHIRAVVEARGKHLKGKPRAQNGASNPLGGRIYDMNCGWPMYRAPYQGSFRYVCGCYTQSHGAKCGHHHIAGPLATRLALSCLTQKALGANNGLAKL